MARWWLELAWLLVSVVQIGYSAMAVSSIRPPDGDTSWWACAETCEDVSLCSPLSPQPDRRREVVAPLAGGARDLFAYGANGSEWKLWLDPEISGGKITTIPVFNSVAGGFSGGTNAGLLCAAHRLGVRVVDWDTVAGMYEPFEFVNFPERILNNTARDIWIEMAVHFMVASGIDGFALDIEGAIYNLMMDSAPAREALTTMLEKLKTRMHQLVPGSLLAVWVQGGNPWNPRFSEVQMARTVAAVDQFWSMEYSACGMPYAGMPEAPWPWIKRNLNRSLSLGLRRDQIVEVFPWHDCDYNCGKDTNCSKLRPREYCDPPVPGKFCFNNITSRGYEQTLPLIALGESQGYVRFYNDSQGAWNIGYYNHSSDEYHQIWWDNPTSLAKKYAWSAAESLRGVGMWVPSATLYDRAAARAMWAAVPKW